MAIAATMGRPISRTSPHRITAPTAGGGQRHRGSGGRKQAQQGARSRLETVNASHTASRPTTGGIAPRAGSSAPTTHRGAVALHGRPVPGYDIALDPPAVGNGYRAVGGDGVLTGGAPDEDVAVERYERIVHRALDHHGTVEDDDVVDRLARSDLGPTGQHDDVVGLLFGLRTGRRRGRVRANSARAG